MTEAPHASLSEEVIREALSVLRGGARFLVTCHRRPDADALGSAIGMTVLCQSLGKDITLWIPEPLAPNLQFLATQFVAEGGVIERTLADGERYDATFVMDTAAHTLLPPGLPSDDVTGPLVVVDHHAIHDDVGDVVVRDIEACSTGEVVMDLAEALGMRPVPRGAAAPLYAAIVADTGGFRYSTTRSKTLRLGAELLDQGVDAWHTAYELFEGWTPERMKLLGVVLDTLELAFDGRCAILRITRKMLDDCQATDDMVEGMVNYGRMLRGVEVAILLWEFPNSEGGLDTKISLRSSGDANVGAIAQKLQGGGHRAAAGGQVSKSLAETETLARAAILSELDG